MKKFKKWSKEMREIINNPTVRILPGQIAFFLILSIFPLLMVVGYVASFFDVSVSTFIKMIGDALPKEIADVFIAYISGKSFDGSIGITIFIGIFLASNGSHAIITASNALYGFPADDVVKRRVKALFLILILVILFGFILVVLAYGNVIAKWFIVTFNLPDIATTIYRIFTLVKWPIAMIIMYFTIKLVYVISPDWQILAKNTTKGALFTTTGWLLTTALFSFYVSHLSRYDIFYGSLANVVALMIWVYVISYILVVGIAINVREYRDKEE